ncbi:ABC transporter substrate-binding protein [Bdellovibrionota bacterium FG-1]
MKVRIGFNSTTSVTEFDPTRIRLVSEAVVLDNLFSPLIRTADDGSIFPDAAEKYFWDGNELHFVMRSDLKTVDGDPITAEDAEVTFKRLLIDRDNAHGDLQTFLCPNAKIKSIHDRCEGMRVEGNHFILKVLKAEYRPFLMQMLINMDFGIIPRIALDQSTPLPKIKNYRKTSGPYYVEKEDHPGAFVLRANPHHWLSKTGIPEILEFHPFELPEQALEALAKGQVDYVSGVHTEGTKEITEMRKNPDLRFFDTQPIKKFIVATTRDRLKNFSAEERQAVFELFRKAYFKEFEGTDWKPSLEFFPVFGEGGLTPEQRKAFDEWREKASKTPIHRPFTLATGKRRIKMLRKLFQNEPLVQVVEVKTAAPFLRPEERPDFYVTPIDTGFFESINLVSYNIKAQKFDLSPEEGRVWLGKYMSLPEKEQRLAMLRELHLDALKKGLIGVIAESPYTHITRKPFRYDGGKYFAGSELWPIRQD